MEEQLLGCLLCLVLVAFAITLKVHKCERTDNIVTTLIISMAFSGFEANGSGLQSRKGRPYTGFKQWLCQVTFYINFPERHVALGPTSRQ